MSTCLPVSVFFTRFLPHGVTAGVTFFVVGCVPFLPMLCLIRLFVCSVRLGRSLRPASFPVLHARRRRLQSFPSVHHALVVVDFRGHVVRFGVVNVPVDFHVGEFCGFFGCADPIVAVVLVLGDLLFEFGPGFPHAGSVVGVDVSFTAVLVCGYDFRAETLMLVGLFHDLVHLGFAVGNHVVQFFGVDAVELAVLGLCTRRMSGAICA